MNTIVSAGEAPRVTINYDFFAEDLISRGLAPRPDIDTDAVVANMHTLSDGVSRLLPDVDITIGEIVPSNTNLEGAQLEGQHYIFGRADNVAEEKKVIIQLGLAQCIGFSRAFDLVARQAGDGVATTMTPETFEGYTLSSSAEMDVILLHELKHAVDFYNLRMMRQQQRYRTFCEKGKSRVENMVVGLVATGGLTALLGMERNDMHGLLVSGFGIAGAVYGGQRATKYIDNETKRRVETWHEESPLERSAYDVDAASPSYRPMVTNGLEIPRNNFICW